MNIQPIILAAGRGVRMGGDLPKVLHEVNGRPMVSHLLEALADLQLEHKPIVVVGYKSEDVKNALGDSCLYALQEPQLGTGHAVSVAEDLIAAPHVAVLNGDTSFVSAQTLKDLFDSHVASGAVMSLATVTVEDFEGWKTMFASHGRIIRDASGKVVAIREYKDASDSEREIRELNVGVYVFDSAWLTEHLGKLDNNNAQGEYYLTDLVAMALSTPKDSPTVSMSPLEALSINTPEHLQYASQLVQARK